MNHEFWYLTAVLLSLRAMLFPASEGISSKRTVLLCVFSIAAIGVIRLTWALLPLAITILIVHGADFAIERSSRTRVQHTAVRLVTGILLILISSVAFRPGSALTFGAAARWLGTLITDYSYLGSRIDRTSAYYLWLYLAAGVYAAFEANYIVAVVLHALRIEPRQGRDEPADEGELSRGRVIGILERLLILAFTIGQSVSAIGFILAAKGFARFKELDNKDFAEYVLVGTLLSASLAVGVGLLIRGFL
jgi:hypothetical protein